MRMPDFLFAHFIQLDLPTMLQVVLLGFIGGILSGFIGSGGAFFMTPGMMNLGVPGVVAVGSNITHKFGKAMVGSRKHAEMGNVDRRLGAYLIATSFIGIRIAVWINSRLFAGGGDGHGTGGSPAADLYISAVFISILAVVGISMLRDVINAPRQQEVAMPSRRLRETIGRLRLPPYIRFEVADVRISLWIIMLVGLATGYLAGTIGVGGFIGVPAMIYVFGIPTAVAAGTELYLAMFMGAFGAINYAFNGFVDLRLTLLLYLGSLIGVYMGAYGTKVVKEIVIRLVTGTIIILCVVSRLVAVPGYLGHLGWMELDPGWESGLNLASKIILFFAGVSGAAVILWNVIRAYLHRRHIRTSLIEAEVPARLAQGPVRRETAVAGKGADVR
jgi:uncharacterized membrane protein YfcA